MLRSKGRQGLLKWREPPFECESIAARENPPCVVQQYIIGVSVHARYTVYKRLCDDVSYIETAMRNTVEKVGETQVLHAYDM